MKTIEILKKMISEKAIVQMKTNYDKYYCILDEDGCDYKLIINNMPEDSIIIKADKFPESTNFFRGSNMECKRADYIVVSSNGNKKVVIYIELKNTKASSSAKKIVAQLKGAKCLMNYCKAIAEEFWEEKEFLNEYKDRYVRFVAKSLDKRNTRVKTGDINDSPKNALVLKNRDSIQFKQLTGRI